MMKSLAQKGYMFMMHPDLAKEMMGKTSPEMMANMPEHVGDGKKKSKYEALLKKKKED